MEGEVTAAMADSKHMEFIQAAITRMAQNSFLAKGWSITLTTALLGIAIRDGAYQFALLGLLPVLMFWILDAYYLALERSFRKLFDVAKGQYSSTPSFDMGAKATPGSVFRAMFDGVAPLVHAPMAVSLAAAYFWLRLGL